VVRGFDRLWALALVPFAVVTATKMDILICYCGCELVVISPVTALVSAGTAGPGGCNLEYEMLGVSQKLPAEIAGVKPGFRTTGRQPVRVRAGPGFIRGKWNVVFFYPKDFFVCPTRSPSLCEFEFGDRDAVSRRD
jgi:hypothetical protein